MGILGIPAGGELFANDLHVAALDGSRQHFALTFAQEVGVGVTWVTLDDGVVALGFDGQDGTSGHAADFLVVKRDVGDIGRFEQAVIGDHGDLQLCSLVDGGHDGVLVLGQNDQHLGALGDQAVDVGQLLFSRGAGVGHDVFGARLGELSLDGGFIGLPAFFLEGVVAHADHQLRKGRTCSHGECQCGQLTFEFHICLQKSPLWGTCIEWTPAGPITPA